MERVRWAPKLKQNLIWRLYQSDAAGALDEDLAAEVGYALLARCKSILLVSEGQVECPRCGAVFQMRGVQVDPIACPTQGCGWEVTHEHYHNTWRHQDLIGTKGKDAFQAYVTQFARANTPEERMVSIDSLIHAFHWGIIAETPHRAVANNLIEGSLKEVVAFLDTLSNGEETEEKKKWSSQVVRMWKARHGEMDEGGIQDGFERSFYR